MGLLNKRTKMFIDNGEVVQGEVMPDNVVIVPPPSFAQKAWAFFHSSNHNQTVGGNAWEKKYKRKPFNDNGREFNPRTGNWEYTAEANGNANPCQCNYEAPQDYQGSVPVWDGYNGE